ncbi:MAG: hypothetical protein QOC58_919, partial [Mycobacterium sp.]|nr:hypothetical protein [Mycobacterium sp.]
AAYAALRRAADTTFDDRSRGQVMADTLVERVTGRPAEVACPVAVNLVMSDETLLVEDDTAATVDGYGPIPAAVARHLVRDAVADARSRATLRRLYRHPRSGSSGCATSDVAPPTATPRSATATTPGRIGAAGRPPRATGSVPARAATTPRRRPGWRVSTATGETGRHKAEFVTPTGAHYRSTAPPKPGRLEIFVSEVEARIAVTLARHAA